MRVIKDKGESESLIAGNIPKLLILFLCLSIIPLMVLGYMANKNMPKPDWNPRPLP